MRSISILLVLAACGHGSKAGNGDGEGTGTSTTTDDTCTASTEDQYRQVYADLKGGEAPTQEDFCVSISATFQGWVNFGWFAHDRGCEFDTFVYQCKLTTPDVPARAMAAAGWADADPAGRTALLVAYLVEILDINLVMTDSRGDFPKYDQTFTPPTYDGGFFTYWQSDAGGDSPEVTYVQMKWDVNADGTLGEPEEQAQFTTVYP